MTHNSDRCFCDCKLWLTSLFPPFFSSSLSLFRTQESRFKSSQRSRTARPAWWCQRRPFTRPRPSMPKGRWRRSSSWSPTCGESLCPLAKRRPGTARCSRFHQFRPPSWTAASSEWSTLSWWVQFPDSSAQTSRNANIGVSACATVLSSLPIFRKVISVESIFPSRTVFVLTLLPKPYLNLDCTLHMALIRALAQKTGSNICPQGAYKLITLNDAA